MTVSMRQTMVTGHRKVMYSYRVRSMLRELAKDAGVAVSGGAEGTDTEWAAAAVAVGTPFRLILPNRYYTSYYVRSIPRRLADRATAIDYAVDRPEVEGWRALWSTEKWWCDNFARNARMVHETGRTVCVSPIDPVKLIETPKGGTAACLRDVRRMRGAGAEVLWVSDQVDGQITVVHL